MEATLQEILNARERRVNKQQELLNTYQKPLICFTMNIPGPVKLDRDILIGFSVGHWLLCDALGGHSVLYRELLYHNTGCEGYYIADMPAKELKRLAMDVEDLEPIGRLFDIDVIDTDGKKLDRESMGMPKRKCLLCDEDAVVCARSRAHSLEQLQDRTGFLLYIAARQWMAEYVAARAWLALNKEVTTTPKPGLVDRNNRGSHPDMGMKHFFASNNALRPYFCKFTEAGFLTRDLDPKETFQAIRSIGKDAEAAMLRATHGVNTHKGAIFSLGIVCAAAGRLTPNNWKADNLLKECAAMARGVTDADLAGITEENAKTVGEKLFAQHGITGVRGQAEAGFPAVRNIGLPVLRQALGEGRGMNHAGCITLLHLLAAIDDTNLIHRSNRQTQLQIKKELSAFLQQTPCPDSSTISAMDEEFIKRNLSPGGSADLLALTYFLYYLEQ